MIYIRFLICLLWAASFNQANALELLKGELSHSSYAVHIEGNGYSPDAEHFLAVKITPKAGWHTYWKNPGDSGAAPYFSWTVPDGVTIGGAQYEVPEVIPVEHLMNYGYHGSSTLLFPLSISGDVAAQELTFKVIAEWLVCEIECVPQVTNWEFRLPQGKQDTASTDDSVFQNFRAKTPEASYWDGNLTISSQNSSLLVFADTQDLPEIQSITFFPEGEGVLIYAAKQAWSWDAYGLKIDFERAAGSQVPNVGNGLLKFHFVDGSTQTFELEPKLTLNIRTTSDGLANPTNSFVMPVWQAAAFALLGGLILNLMPCVFPVLSLKAFALVSANYKSASNRRKEGWAYTFGIWISFMAIVGALVGLRSGGAAIGWGFQLQEPLFIAFLILLMVLVALSLAGVFHIRLGIEGAGQSLTIREGLSGSFAKGVLATLVATPCTAPFMAPAIGYALTQPTPVILLVFTMLAFGLALPFLLLSYSETLARLMPKPGVWMEKVKQGLAFPMLLTAAWLLYVYDLQAGSEAALFMVIAAITLSFGVWLMQQTAHIIGKGFSYLAIVAALAVVFSVSETREIDSENHLDGAEKAYSAAELDILLEENKAVFVYFTAEWCITCKVNEQVALHTEGVQKVMTEKNITVMKGDWTNRNSEIASVLAKFGRAGVPLYLYFSEGSKEPLVLPEILTKDILIKAITN